MPKKTAKTELTTTPIDQNLLDGAVDFINRSMHASSVQLAVIISEYVVATFFAGDVGLLSSKDPTKLLSFRALCEHPGLEMGVSTLQRLVRVGVQVRHLPADLAENLTMTHHRSLLAVPNAAHKQALARMAVKQHWSVQKLQAVIAAEHPQPPTHAGRATKPALLKWLTAMEKAVADQPETAVITAEFSLLAADEQIKLRVGLTALNQTLQQALAALAAN